MCWAKSFEKDWKWLKGVTLLSIASAILFGLMLFGLYKDTKVSFESYKEDILLGNSSFNGYYNIGYIGEIETDNSGKMYEYSIRIGSDNVRVALSTKEGIEENTKYPISGIKSSYPRGITDYDLANEGILKSLEVNLFNIDELLYEKYLDSIRIDKNTFEFIRNVFLVFLLLIVYLIGDGVWQLYKKKKMYVGDGKVLVNGRWAKKVGDDSL